MLLNPGVAPGGIEPTSMESKVPRTTVMQRSYKKSLVLDSNQRGNSPSAYKAGAINRTMRTRQMWTRRELNSLRRPLQGRALPMSYVSNSPSFLLDVLHPPHEHGFSPCVHWRRFFYLGNLLRVVVESNHFRSFCRAPGLRDRTTRKPRNIISSSA